MQSVLWIHHTPITFVLDPAHNVSITASSGECAGNADSCEKLNSDTLTCASSGFPEPEYEWSYPGGKEVGPSVVAKKNIVYKCTATNYYADQPHSASSTLQVFWLCKYSDSQFQFKGLI